jgi:hypothetical protein
MNVQRLEFVMLMKTVMICSICVLEQSNMLQQSVG